MLSRMWLSSSVMKGMLITILHMWVMLRTRQVEF